MNVTDWLLRRQDRPALITLHATHSHAQLTDASEGVAAWLLGAGARPGEFVAVVAENSFFSLACWMGVMRAGCVAVPLATTVSQETWRLIASSTTLRFACLQKDTAELVAALPDDGRLVTEAPTTDPRAVSFAQVSATAPVEWPVLEESALAMLLFTSGSTGVPRGVMLTHQNLIANATGIIECVGLTPDDRVMVVLPFCYSFGVSLVTTHLGLGACLVIDSRFMFPDKVLERMVESRCTGFAGVPSHYQSLLRRSRLKTMKFPELRWVQQAGGRLAPALVEELRASLPGVRVHVMYGATENTARIACVPPGRLADKPGSVGLPIPGVRVTIQNDDGVVLGPGLVGRVVVEGHSVSPGYFGAADASETVFNAGRLFTSDLGRLDGEGYLFIVDRLGDFLKCGGTRTSVKVVEDALLQCPDVIEVAVLGVPDDLLGEAVAALVVARPGAQQLLERLLSVAKERLPLPLQPKVVRIVETLPRSPGGKVQRPGLRALLS